VIAPQREIAERIDALAAKTTSTNARRRRG
jgi:hypothetical protein